MPDIKTAMMPSPTVDVMNGYILAALEASLLKYGLLGLLGSCRAINNAKSINVSAI